MPEHAGDKPTRVGSLVDEYSVIEEAAVGAEDFQNRVGLEFSVLLEKTRVADFIWRLRPGDLGNAASNS